MRERRVVVIGGGLGGMASAVRLAKLGHEVTLLEASETLGGALRPVTHDGFVWQRGPQATLLPAVIRDLFRKSGRPIERELGELVPVEVIREHRFEDGSRVALPGGSRAAQLNAFDALGPGMGKAWVDYVGAFADDWEVLRQHYFEVPWDPGAVDRAVRREVMARLDGRASLGRRVSRGLRDRRLRQVALHPMNLDVDDPRRVPAWTGVTSYLEQRFGVWTIEGGFHRLADALTARLATRKVEVQVGVKALDVVVRDGRAAAVATDQGDIAADAVVVTIDPRLLPSLRDRAGVQPRSMPPAVTYLGLDSGPALPATVVLHGDPTLVVRSAGDAWTVFHRRSSDVLADLSARGLDVRDRVVTRLDLHARELLNSDSSPFGLRWKGRTTTRRRLGPMTPIPGVYAAGAHAAPGAGVPFVGLSAALVVQAMGHDTRA